MRRAGLYCLVLALFSASGAYWTGLSAAAEAQQLPGIMGLLEDHKNAGILTLVLCGVMLIVRVFVFSRQGFRRLGTAIYLLIALMSVVNVWRAGYLGAEMVYVHGVGVKPVMKMHLKPAETPENH